MTDFDEKLSNLNKKLTAVKTKHVEAEKKLTDLRKTFAKKGHNFLLGILKVMIIIRILYFVSQCLGH